MFNTEDHGDRFRKEPTPVFDGNGTVEFLHHKKFQDLLASIGPENRTLEITVAGHRRELIELDAGMVTVFAKRNCRKCHGRGVQNFVGRVDICDCALGKILKARKA